MNVLVCCLLLSLTLVGTMAARTPTRKPTRAPTTYEPTNTARPSLSKSPTNLPTLSPTLPPPIIYFSVQQAVTLDDRVVVDDINVLDTFQQSLATSAGLATENVESLSFVEENVVASEYSFLPSIQDSVRRVLFQRMLTATKSYSMRYSINTLQTSSSISVTSIKDTISYKVQTGAFVSTLLSNANSNNVNLYYVVNVTQFDPNLVVVDLSPSASPTKKPSSSPELLTTQTKLILGVVVGVVGLIVFMACMAFLSLCLRRNCEELKKHRVEQRQERHRKEEAVLEEVAEHIEDVTLGVETSSAVDYRVSPDHSASFHGSEGGLPTPPLPRRLSSRAHSFRSRQSSGSDFSRESSPNQHARKKLHGSPHRMGSRVNSMSGSEYGSLSGLNDSYQRPMRSNPGSDYGFVGLNDAYDQGSHVGGGGSVVGSVASDHSSVVLGASPVGPTQAQMYLVHHPQQQAAMQQQLAMQQQMAMQQQQQQAAMQHQAAMQQHALRQSMSFYQQQAAMQQMQMQQQAMMNQSMHRIPTPPPVGIAYQAATPPVQYAAPQVVGYPPRPPAM